MPFYTTKLTGTGLGLSQVYGFAKQTGGAVTASSSPEDDAGGDRIQGDRRKRP